jgi:hypothetical protein
MYSTIMQNFISKFYKNKVISKNKILQAPRTIHIVFSYFSLVKILDFNNPKTSHSASELSSNIILHIENNKS